MTDECPCCHRPFPYGVCQDCEEYYCRGCGVACGDRLCDVCEEFRCRDCGVACGDRLCDVCEEFRCRECGVACGDTLCDDCRDCRDALIREEAGDRSHLAAISLLLNVVHMISCNT